MYIEGLGPSITVQERSLEKQLFWSFSKRNKTSVVFKSLPSFGFCCCRYTARVTLYKVDGVYTFTFCSITSSSLYQIWNLSRHWLHLTSTGFLHNPTTISCTLKCPQKSIYQFKIKAGYSPKQNKRTTCVHNSYKLEFWNDIISGSNPSSVTY